MVSEQSLYTVGDLVKMGVLEKPLDGNHGETHPKGNDFIKSGIPFIMASDMANGLIDTINCKFISEDQAKTLRKGFAISGDVLLSHKATIGRTALVGELESAYIVLTPQVTYYRIKDPTKLNNRYLKYYFDSYEFQSLLSQWAGGGSTRAYLGITGQLKLPIKILDISQQKAIVDVLGCLDDKIELNRKMNETLEAMAQELFKSWFVDFDPVIDNALAAGNPIPDEFFERVEKRKGVQKNKSQDDHQICSLFPDEFEFTEEMGWIPKGWAITPVYEVADFVNGSSFDSQYFSDKNKGLPIVKIAEIKNGISEQTKFTTQEMPEKYLINDGAILFSWSGNPDTSIDTFIWTSGKGWLNQHIFNVVLRKPSDKTFVYYLLKCLKPIFTEIARDKQTTGLGHVTVKDMKRIYTIKPPVEVLEAFGLYSNSIFEKWYQNLFSSKELAKLRDTLLPKLISGEIRIPEAEALVEDV